MSALADSGKDQNIGNGRDYGGFAIALRQMDAVWLYCRMLSIVEVAVGIELHQTN